MDYYNAGMGYSIEATEWPAIAMSTETKTLIETFFTLMDDPSDGVGDKLADEIFTHDGILCGGLGVAVGTTGTTSNLFPPYSLMHVLTL